MSQLNDKTWKELNKAGVYLSEYEGDPFIIFNSWSQLSQANKIINENECLEKWQEWEDVYRASAILFDNDENPYSDMRLGQLTVRTLIKKPRIYQKLYNAIEDAGFLSREETALTIISNTGRATPYNSESPYTVPEGLMSIDDIADWGFNDEWGECEECLKVLRTQPDSYMWKPRYWSPYDDGLMLCENCIDPEDYINAYINQADKALNDDLVDPEEHGWHRIDQRFENGLHSGMNADPKKIVEILNGNNIDCLFTYEPSQFYIEFNVWVKPDDVANTIILLSQTNTDLPYDQAEEFSKALKGLPHHEDVNVRMYTLNENNDLEDQDGNILDWDK